MRVRFKTRPNPEVRSLEQALNWQVAEVKALAVILDTEFADQEKKLFASQGASGGGRWKRLNPQYARVKPQSASLVTGVGERLGTPNRRWSAIARRFESVGVHCANRHAGQCRVARGSHPPRALSRSGQGDFHHPAPPLTRLVVTVPRFER